MKSNYSFSYDRNHNLLVRLLTTCSLKLKTKTETIKIKSIILTKNLLTELCRIVDNEFVEFKNDKENTDELSWLEYVLDMNGSSYETEDSKSFLEETIPPDFKRIKMNFHGGDKRTIEIEIWPDVDSNTFTVKGTDLKWSNGIIRTIE